MLIKLRDKYRSWRLKRHVQKWGSKNKGYFQCFDQKIFDWQKQLIWLLNTPYVRVWFRHKLRIDQDKESKGKLIAEIRPDKYFINNNDGTRTMVVRTHHKYSKRLYYGFFPVWWMLHFLDWLLFERWMPELSFGFDTLTAYPDADPESDAVDGYIDCLSFSSWTACRDAATGNNAYPSNDRVRVRTRKINEEGSDIWQILRGFECFNTNASGGTATAGVLQNYLDSKYGESVTTYSVDASIDSNTNLTTSDYNNLGSVNYGSVNPSSSGYQDITLNENGIANIDLQGVSKFALRIYSDYQNVEPNTGEDNDVIYYSADYTGTSNDPKLVVTYTLPAGQKSQMVV
ncbi:MAG: hypothetical protein PHX51_07215 [Clostridia bacterium]|nr:hypothetical protein [Clostridia bacterium]